MRPEADLYSYVQDLEKHLQMTLFGGMADPEGAVLLVRGASARQVAVRPSRASVRSEFHMAEHSVASARAVVLLGLHRPSDLVVPGLQGQPGGRGLADRDVP